MTQDPECANIEQPNARHPGTACGQHSKSVRYEGYGPGGSALLVQCATDDPERTRTRLRCVFRAHGGHLGAEESVAYLFDRVGLMRYPSGSGREALIQAALSAGAERVIDRLGAVEVLADPEEFEAIRIQLYRLGFVPLTAVVAERAAICVPLSGEANEELLGLIDALAQLEDVQDVCTNAEPVVEDPPGEV